MEEGREKLAAKVDVTGTAGSGSQTSEMEAEPLSAEVEDRKEEIRHSKNNICKTWRRTGGMPKRVEEEKLLLKAGLPAQQEVDIEILT